MKTIIHFNHHTALNRNIGDEAHVLAIQNAISQQSSEEVTFVNVPIDVLSTRQIPALPGLKRVPRIAHDIYRQLHPKYSLKNVITLCNNADMVLIGGGGVYMEYLWPLHPVIVDSIVKPITIYGVGYNHNFGASEFSTTQLASVRQLGNKAKLHTVRDANTQAFLKSNGVASELLCDPAIFLQSLPTAYTARPAKLHVGINIASHGWRQQKDYETKLVDIYEQVTKALQIQYQAKIYYFLHHPNELEICNQLRSRGIQLEDIIRLDARGMRTAYEQMDFALCMMLHSTILAFAAGIPSICIGYDRKNLSFMKLTAQEDRYVSVDEAEYQTIWPNVELLIKNLDQSKMKVVRTKNEFEKHHTEFARRVCKLLLP